MYTGDNMDSGLSSICLLPNKHDKQSSNFHILHYCSIYPCGSGEYACNPFFLLFFLFFLFPFLVFLGFLEKGMLCCGTRKFYASIIFLLLMSSSSSSSLFSPPWSMKTWMYPQNVRHLCHHANWLTTTTSSFQFNIIMIWTHRYQKIGALWTFFFWFFSLTLANPKVSS